MHGSACTYGLDPVLLVTWHPISAGTSIWDMTSPLDRCAVWWEAEQAAGGAGL